MYMTKKITMSRQCSSRFHSCHPASTHQQQRHHRDHAGDEAVEVLEHRLLDLLGGGALRAGRAGASRTRQASRQPEVPSGWASRGDEERCSGRHLDLLTVLTHREVGCHLGRVDLTLGRYGPGFGRTFPPGKASRRIVRWTVPSCLLKRAGVVGQPVAAADVAHARRDLGVAAGGHVGVEVVLDLEAQVAREQVKQRAAVDVRRAQQLAHVPAAAGLIRDLRLAERVGLIGEVPAEDDRVGPHVAHDVRGEVRRQRRLERAAAAELRARRRSAGCPDDPRRRARAPRRPRTARETRCSP